MKLRGAAMCYLPDLLTEQLGLTQVRVAAICEPLADKEFTQEGIQRLLLTSKLLATAAILLVESSEEPFEDKEGSLLGVSLLSRSDEDSGVFGPVGGVLGQRGG